MTNEPKIMKEIHDIRLNHYAEEADLSKREIAKKRRNESKEIDKIIMEYGLTVFSDDNLKNVKRGEINNA